MGLDGAEPIFDVGKGGKPAMRIRSFNAVEGFADNGDGTHAVSSEVVPRVERRPNGKVLMVLDSAGNIVPLKVHNAMSVDERDDPYKYDVMRKKMKPNTDQGWNTFGMMPVSECPQQGQYEFMLADGKRSGRRCVQAADGQPIGEDRTGAIHVCKCIAEEQERRQTLNYDKQSKLKSKDQTEKLLLHASLGNAAQMTELLQKLTALEEAKAAEALAAKAKAPK